MVKKAVDWSSGQFFKFVHQNNLVYNTCWEDPRLDRQALQLNDKDNVLMITSAGCNALDYALDNPNHIFCVDMNPRQNALLELKMAGIKRLDFDKFFKIFGEGRLENFETVYYRELRDLLSEPARFHWDRHLSYFAGSRLRPSFYYRGTSGLFAQLMNYYVRANRTRKHVMDCFEAGSVDAQREIYESSIRPVFWNEFVRWTFRKDATLSLLGVPRAQRVQVEKDYQGGIAKFMEDCVETVFTRLPLSDNYFWWLYVNGAYSKDRCPEYLKEENFNKLQAGAVNNISTHTTSILDFLRFNEVNISKYVLLDHMDWLSTHSIQVLAHEWQEMLNSATESARFLWRSGGLEVDFVDPLTVVYDGMVRRVGDFLTYDTEKAKDLHVQDRVHTYGSFYIADFAPC